MIKIININRKVRGQQSDDGPVLHLSDPSCNTVIAADAFYNKAHFDLTEQEAEEFDRLAQKVEQRIIRDIADSYIGLHALQPLEEPKQEGGPEIASAATA